MDLKQSYKIWMCTWAFTIKGICKSLCTLTSNDGVCCLLMLVAQWFSWVIYDPLIYLRV